MPNKNDFIAIFITESEEHLTKLNKGLVELEKHPGNLELLKELNRVAHTLKGSARIFGFHEIQEIAHKIEDALDQLSQKKMALNSSIVDKIFKGLDVVKAILVKIAKAETIDVDVTGVCKEIEECLLVRPGFSDRDKPGEISPTPAAVKMKAARGIKQKEEQKTEEKIPKAKKEATEQSVVSEGYIRVPLGRVNKLLNLVGEMVINKMKSSSKIAETKKLAQLAKDTQKTFSSLTDRIKGGLTSETTKMLSQCSAQLQDLRKGSGTLYDNISTEAFHLDPVVDELQSRMKEIRMLPCSTIFETFPRMVRDIASKEGKSINLEITGGETELDKKVLEGIKASLMHLLRNCIDHGIEDPDVRIKSGKSKTGTIKLSAYHKAGNVVIEVADDGKGIDIEVVKQVAIKKGLALAEEVENMADAEALNLIFLNGFSTSPIITDVSGRGIGLDVVRQDIAGLKGQVFLKNQKGVGTNFTLILPLTVAIIQVFLIKESGILFAIPMTSVAESLKVNVNDISTIETRMAIQVRGRTLPVVKLSKILGLPEIQTEGEEAKAGDKKKEKSLSVIILNSLEKKVGFIVDEIKGEDEVFIKSLGEYLGKVNNIAGATILGTGAVVVILDAADLIANSALSYSATTAKKIAVKERKKEKRILVVEDALSTRELEKTILETQGYVVDTAVDGMDALDKVTQAKYDLFVTDIQMPRMDGFEFCKTLKKNDEYKNIPVIIVTALEKEEDKRRGIEVGAQAYIVKTAFDQSSLLDTIERLIG